MAFMIPNVCSASGGYMQRHECHLQVLSEMIISNESNILTSRVLSHFNRSRQLLFTIKLRYKDLEKVTTPPAAQLKSSHYTVMCTSPAAAHRTAAATHLNEMSDPMSTTGKWTS